MGPLPAQWACFQIYRFVLSKMIFWKYRTDQTKCCKENSKGKKKVMNKLKRWHTYSGGGILAGSTSLRKSLLRACSAVQRLLGSRASMWSNRSRAVGGILNTADQKGEKKLIEKWNKMALLLSKPRHSAQSVHHDIVLQYTCSNGAFMCYFYH